jgi:hypothetical protein
MDVNHMKLSLLDYKAMLDSTDHAILELYQEHSV